jgi:hypothetical protein
MPNRVEVIFIANLDPVIGIGSEQEKNKASGSN